MGSPANRPHARALLVVLGVALGFGASAGARAQLLDRASTVVRGGDDDDDDTRSDDDDHDSATDDDDDDAEIVYDARDPFVDDSALDPVTAGYPPAPRPYAEWDDPSRPDGAASVELEGAYVLGGAARAGLGARLSGASHLDFALRVSLYGEPRDDGGLDVLGLGRAGLDWRIVDLSRVTARIGLGGRIFADARGPLFGVDAALGLVVLPFEPFSIMVDGELGFVGSAVLTQARVALGIVRGPWVIYGGYDYVALLSDAGIAELGGPTIGVQLWR